MAQNWLLKTEPKDYSYENLERDRCTIWDGVSNRLALKHLNQMDFGDQAFIYHTGRVRAIIGIADVVSSPYPDPEKDDPKLTVVDVEARKRLDRPVTLKEVKADPRFSGFILVRLPRLSVHARVRYPVAAVAGDVRVVNPLYSVPDISTCNRRTGSSSWLSSPCSRGSTRYGEASSFCGCSERPRRRFRDPMRPR